MGNVTHLHKKYKEKWHALGGGKYNGAYFYSQEIVKNIIPEVKTDRPWITVNVPEAGAEDRAIVFIHNNLNLSNYEWLREYKDLVLICGIPETAEKLKHLGTAIYIPLSVDVEEVEKFRIPEEEKKDGPVYFGRRRKRTLKVPQEAPTFSGLPRDDLLRQMAKYKSEVYAVGRCAIEAKILCGEEALRPYDPRFPDTDRWQILDNKDAAKLIQEELDKIDKKKKPAKKKEEAPETKEKKEKPKKKTGGRKKKVVKEE